METVFDHDPTQDELLYLFDSQQGIDLVREHGNEQGRAYAEIVYLYDHRGDTKTRDKYLAKITDPELHLEVTMMLFECKG